MAVNEQFPSLMPTPYPGDLATVSRLFGTLDAMWLAFETLANNKTRCLAVVCSTGPLIYTWYETQKLVQSYIFFIMIIICLLTMCRALFNRNETADIYHRIPLTSSNLFSFPAYTHLNMHPHHLPKYFTLYVSIRHASYSASTFHPHAMGSSPPSSSLLPLAAWRSRRASLYRCTLREIATWVVTDMTWKWCY